MSSRHHLRGLVALAALLLPAPAAAQLSVTGVVRAHEEVVVQSELAGIVQQIAVREGDRVTEGQLLLELRNERQKISLDLARAGLVQATALVQETVILLENAEKELARVRIAASALPRKELEDVEDQVLRLKASLEAQRAELARAEEEVRLREHELRETQLLAPFGGTITEIHVNRGESLRPMETPVLQLVDLEQLYVELLLPSSSLRQVRPSQTIRVQIEGEWMGRSGQVDGRVLYVNPTVDAASRTFKVKVEIPNADGRIRPGMLAEVRFTP